MAQLKMNKHQIYNILANHPEWFNGKGITSYRSCYSLGNGINALLKKDAGSDPPFIKLSGATLTAMVNDGVLERTFVDFERCYRYRLVLPINEEYRSV